MHLIDTILNLCQDLVEGFLITSTKMQICVTRNQRLFIS